MVTEEALVFEEGAYDDVDEAGYDGASRLAVGSWLAVVRYEDVAFVE